MSEEASTSSPCGGPATPTTPPGKGFEDRFAQRYHYALQEGCGLPMAA